MSSEYPFSTKAKENQIHLRILETTDLHVHIHPYDYYADQSSDRVGLARAATMIERLRGDAARWAITWLMSTDWATAQCILCSKR